MSQSDPTSRPIIRKKKKSGEAFLIIFLILLLIGAIVIGLGLIGIVNIPGITPEKKLPVHSEATPSKPKPLKEKKKVPSAPGHSNNNQPKIPLPLQSHTPAPTLTSSPSQLLNHPQPTHHQYTPPQAPKTDPQKGAKKIAALWDQMDTKELVLLVKNWNNLELAEVIMQMSPSKASALLAALDPKRASQISKIIQQEGSIVTPPAK